MASLKTITISLPLEMGREIASMAKSEHRTISELLRETFRQYKATRNFHQLSKMVKKSVKKKKLSPKDFGGPFAD